MSSCIFYKLDQAHDLNLREGARKQAKTPSVSTHLWREWLLPDSTFMHQFGTDRGFIGGAWEALTEPRMQTGKVWYSCKETMEEGTGLGGLCCLEDFVPSQSLRASLQKEFSTSQTGG